MKSHFSSVVVVLTLLLLLARTFPWWGPPNFNCCLHIFIYISLTVDSPLASGGIKKVMGVILKKTECRAIWNALIPSGLGLALTHEVWKLLLGLERYQKGYRDCPRLIFIYISVKNLPPWLLVRTGFLEFSKALFQKQCTHKNRKKYSCFIVEPQNEWKISY